MFPPKSNSWHRSAQFSQFRPVVQGAGCIPEGCRTSADAGAAKIEVASLEFLNVVLSLAHDVADATSVV